MNQNQNNSVDPALMTPEWYIAFFAVNKDAALEFMSGMDYRQALTRGQAVVEYRFAMIAFQALANNLELTESEIAKRAWRLAKAMSNEGYGWK